LGFGTIQDVKTPEGPEIGRRIPFEDTAGQFVTLSEYKRVSVVSLSEIAGSLARITRLKNPSSHFARNVLAFHDSMDYRVIVDGHRYMARTIFRQYFSCLPHAVQLQFLASVGIERLGLVHERIYRYESIAAELLRFLRPAAGDLIEYLIGIERITSQMASAGRIFLVD
jgi:hypothetical protein